MLVISISNEMTDEANQVIENLEKEAAEGYKAKDTWKGRGIGAGAAHP